MDKMLLPLMNFLVKRWSAPTNGSEPTVGKTLLKDRGLFTTESWYWICIIALFTFSLLFNVLFVAALTYLNPLGDNKAIIADDNEESKKQRQMTSNGEGLQMAERNASGAAGVANIEPRRGMVLPFEPLPLAFNHVNYYVDMPDVFRLKVFDEAIQASLKDERELINIKSLSGS